MNRHRHVCRCGAFYVCRLPYELCPMKIWDCPTCEDRELDLYLTQLEAKTQHEQEHAHEGQ